ncbi:FkbM family methyltransferase [Marinobacter sp.]|uniref:FkbM family methyltransferase n=1 Tax=Marinobacter sp. TaxID=50741 RepID=UPI003BAC3D8E
MRNFVTWIVMHAWPFSFAHVRLLYRLKPKKMKQNVVTTRLRGFPVRLTYDPNSEIGRYLYFRGSFEEQILNKIKQVVKSGDLVLDIGANIGVHSLVFSTLVGSSGQVVAIEPQSKVRKRLEVNLENNQIDNVVVLGCAIGAEECSARIYDIAKNNDGAATLRPSKPEKHNKFEDIEVKTLDFIEDRTGFGRFDIVKIDVEGAELEVLKGLSKLFEFRPPRCLFVECIDSNLKRFDTSSEELIARLENFGYRLEAKNKGKWVSINNANRKNCDIYAVLNCSNSGLV